MLCLLAALHVVAVVRVVIVVGVVAEVDGACFL